MSNYQPIIDVTPLDHSSPQSGRRTHVNSSSASDSYRPPSWKTSSTYRATGTSSQTPPYSGPFSYASAGPAATSKTTGSVVGGVAQIVAGTGLVLIGIPMLILPGPGLLSIAGGLALAANGTRKVFG